MKPPEESIEIHWGDGTSDIITPKKEGWLKRLFRKLFRRKRIIDHSYVCVHNYKINIKNKRAGERDE